MTVGRFSLADHSSSGASNETSTSWALSGTPARNIALASAGTTATAGPCPPVARAQASAIQVFPLPRSYAPSADANAVRLFDEIYPTHRWELDDAIHFTFSTNTIPAGGFLVVWCDATTNTTPGLHTGFELDPDGDGLFLFDPWARRGWERMRVDDGLTREPAPLAVFHDGRVFLFNEQGDLIIAKLSPKGYEEISRAHLIDPVNKDTGRQVVWSHPAFANRHVIARNDREVVRLSLDGARRSIEYPVLAGIGASFALGFALAAFALAERFGPRARHAAVAALLLAAAPTDAGRGPPPPSLPARTARPVRRLARLLR